MANQDRDTTTMKNRERERQQRIMENAQSKTERERRRMCFHYLFVGYLRSLPSFHPPLPNHRPGVAESFLGRPIDLTWSEEKEEELSFNILGRYILHTFCSEAKETTVEDNVYQ